MKHTLSIKNLEVEADCMPSIVPLNSHFQNQRLRPLSYSQAHVILIAFSIDTPDSLDNVCTKVSIQERTTDSFDLDLHSGLSLL